MLPNPKDSERNNKEIKKSLQLFKNKDNKEELLIKLEDNKSPKEPNNTKLNTKPLNKLKSPPEDKLNWLDKYLFQLNQDWPSLSEFEVSINLIQDLSESSVFWDLDNYTTEPLLESTKPLSTFWEELSHILLLVIHPDKPSEN